MKSRTDSVLVAATIAFAFLAASFAAANSDLWLHLATGRLIATGDYTIGEDPFSYLSYQSYWANHSWLFDLAAYKVYQLAGGAALVGLKAIGVALLAGVMLRLALKGGGPVWLAAGTTLLAILAMSPRLLLQPQCVSLLFLAVCMTLLNAGGRGLRWVPVLLVVWVNVDAWFILGLGMVLVFAICRRAPALPSADSGSRLRGVAICFAACLLNPHHYHAFALPPELNPAVFPRFGRYFPNPWQFPGLASWAFPVLLGAGFLSFAVNPRTLRAWRLPVWIVFALLGSWQSRLVPFFAVVGGPILAMNLGEVLGANAFPRTGRRIALVLVAFLLVLAWPGWLQSFSARDRAIAWELAPDPSLARVTERARAREARQVLHDSPDAGHYLAWFAPGVRNTVDSRFQLFLGLGRSFEPDFAILNNVSEGPRVPAIHDVAGNVALVDWRLSRSVFDPERLAFAPGSPPASASGPANLVEPPAWWNLAAYRQPPRTWEGEAATSYLRIFERQKGAERSPALPLLAIRSARTSLAEQPRGDDVWVALARGYLFQSRSTWEAATTTDFTLVKYLRHVQVVGALQQAVLANPDNAAAHDLLAGAFGERRMVDLALHHRREQLRLLKKTDGDADRLAAIQEAIKELEAATFESENRFRIHTDSLSGSPLERARIARDLGLGATALDALVKSHSDLYGVEGIRMLLDLLLQTGRLTEARVLLDRDELKNSPAALDLFTLPGGTKNGKPWRYAMPAYNWFDFCQCAAAGHYDRADFAVERIREQLLDVERVALPNVRSVYLRTALSELGATLPLNRTMVQHERELWAVNVAQTQFLASVRGDLHALSGLLHLERGAVREAERDFRLALDRYAENTGPAAVHPARSLAVRYREALRQP